MLTLDTSALVALLARDDPDHARAVATLEEESAPYLVPAGVLGEIAYMIEVRAGADALDNFLADLESGAFSLDCGEDDLPRIRELVRRYSDLPLSFADAAVVVCTERSGGKVFTFDRRDFQVVAGETAITLLPD